MDFSRIVSATIVPAIGIARLGNSPEEFFIGPEAPGEVPDPGGGFKDKQGRVKRQAARFRVFGLDAKGEVVCELNADSAVLEWSVRLANTKAAWFEFHGRFGVKDQPRNPKITDRESLKIDPGERKISGRNERGAPYRFDTGKFRGKFVPLGELQTDRRGRLMVLGGFGNSASMRADNPITNYANNNDWHDDTSDGPVRVRVTLPDQRVLEPEPARVLVVPPKFTPSLENLVNLHEVLEYTWFGMAKVPTRPSFTNDIYPILRRMVGYQWVNALAYRGHGPGKGGDFSDPSLLKRLSSAAAEFMPDRMAVFRRVRNPNLPYDSPEAVQQASYMFMPTLAGDNNGPTNGDATQWLRIRPSQYAILMAWAEGGFEADWREEPERVLLEALPLADRPAAITRAALEPCVGGAFYPGIEMTYISEDKDLFSGPFRLKDLPPGDITKHMACPWQADFYECNTAWWPVARPDDVVPESEYRRVVLEQPPVTNDGTTIPDPRERVADKLAHRVPWDRGLVEWATDSPEGTRGDNAMVELWHELGFVVPRPAGNHETVLVETERAPFVGMSVREYYYYLNNIDDHPEFMPKARELADAFLAEAWDMQSHPDFPNYARFFKYSEEAFDARLKQIYEDLVEENDAYDPATDPNFKTRESVLYRILQMAPFNQNDGAWIHSITPPGPLDEVSSLLFNIWMDEAGDGNVQWSHCNLYTDLLREVGLYLAPPSSRDYAKDPRFLDSAFTVPVMELCLAQFPTAFFPELLGFTLQLEWTVVSLKPTIKLFEYFNLNPRFYELHVGIDNAASGHGAKARDAIKLYLDQARRRGGEEEVQRLWKRIWTGYIAFDQTGTLFPDMLARLSKPPTSADNVAAIINAKKKFAALNHTGKKIGPNYIDDWFEDPPGFMKALVDSGFFVPKQPNQSRFFQLTSFDGPMFKVFTDAELQTWQTWVIEGCPMPNTPVPTPVVLPVGALMAETIDALALLQVGTLGHTKHELTGPDPTQPGRRITQSVAWWFERITEKKPEATLAFMRALADPENGWIIPKRPDVSPFIQDLLAAGRPMGDAFEMVAPGTGGLTRREVAVRWVIEGCPIPERNKNAGKRHSFARVPDPTVYPRPRLTGMGSIH